MERERKWEKGSKKKEGGSGGGRLLAFQQDERGDSSQRNIVCELGFSIRSAGMHQK
jgi:hypothetical protein